MSHDTQDTGEREDVVERLLKLTGSRQDVPPERLARLRTSAHVAWRDSLQDRARARVRGWMIGGIGLAAAASVWFAFSLRQPPAAPRPGSAPSSSVVAHVLLATPAGALKVGDALQAGAIVDTSAGTFLTLRLESGSEVRLDAATVLQVIDTHHLELVRGALYYDGHDTALAIDTPAGVIHDIGTRFEVRVLDRRVRVRVREGLVSLDRSGRLDEAGPGVEMVASSPSGTGIVTHSPVTLYGPGWDWTERAAAPFSLDGQTLSTFLAWIAREGGWSIQFADEALERSATSTILRGSVAGLTTEEALSVVLPTCGLEHQVKGGRVTIRRASASSQGSR
jgi:ferric-dicitrate binding protein FerR (iron transport regulator)